jgi:hypothetical protein
VLAITLCSPDDCKTASRRTKHVFQVAFVSCANSAATAPAPSQANVQSIGRLAGLRHGGTGTPVPRKLVLTAH